MRLRTACFGLSIAAFAAATGCSGGYSSTPLPIAASPTPPPVTQQAAFSTTAVTAFDTAPQVAGHIPVALPSADGYGGTLSMPIPNGSIPAGATLAESLTDNANALPSSVPILESIARSAQDRRSTQAAVLSRIVLITLSSSVALQFPNAPGLSVTIPAADTALPDVSFYTALYDPLRPSLGWQRGFEGPGSVSGTTVTFTPPSPAVPFSLAAMIPEYLGVYAISSDAPLPTPAPSTSPIALPSLPPVFTLSTGTMSLLGIGQTSTATISDTSGYTGAYGATSTAPNVATAVVNGTTVTVTAVGIGQTTIVVGDSQARSALIYVQVTATTVPIQ